ncbi:DUF2971 domain-containing protein [Proteus sp. G2658]|uniref:DUF2971 domain-containing protein n=1 Tax=Proteus sp. G2658 TaxID=2698871 RepID=UPI000AFC2CCB|nr:DUF2971 domain-containing protein [Proteus sp. G2658]
MSIDVSKSLSSEMILWRYMSIDKLIDLLSKNQLFLAPLSSFQKTDPFEGYAPKIALETCQKIMNTTFDEGLRVIIEQLNQSNCTDKEIKLIEDVSKEGKERASSMYYKIMKSSCVSCWYQNDFESEAMWNLYSDSGKGIAIKTNVGSLANSLKKNHKVNLRIGKVKYLNFFDSNLKPEDCLVDGSTSPLLKRKEYEHENEVRLYLVPQPENWDTYEPIPFFLDIDVSTLIEEIYISPYVGEPFTSSVYKICELLGVPENKIKKSKLLDDYKEAMMRIIGA